jgi:hypothetical protein
VRQYLVTETELENVSFMNGVASFCFGVAAFIAPWPIQRVIDFINGPVGAPKPEGLYWLGGLLVIAFLVGGALALRKRGSIYSIIKSETVHDDASQGAVL